MDNSTNYEKVKRKQEVSTKIDAPLQSTSNDRKMHSFMLPFAGAKCNTTLKSMNRCIKRIAPNDVNTQIICTGHKLNTRFQVKDKTTQIHKHDLIYYAKRLKQSYNQDYLNETSRIIEWATDHT